jgi:hypothetical protein
MRSLNYENMDFVMRWGNMEKRRVNVSWKVSFSRISIVSKKRKGKEKKRKE